MFLTSNYILLLHFCSFVVVSNISNMFIVTNRPIAYAIKNNKKIIMCYFTKQPCKFNNYFFAHIIFTFMYILQSATRIVRFIRLYFFTVTLKTDLKIQIINQIPVAIDHLNVKPKHIVISLIIPHVTIKLSP